MPLDSQVIHQAQNGRRRAAPRCQGHQEVMDLKAGEVSEVVTEPNGYYVYKMVSKETASLDTVKPDIRRIISSQRYREGMTGFQPRPGELPLGLVLEELHGQRVYGGRCAARRRSQAIAMRAEPPGGRATNPHPPGVGYSPAGRREGAISSSSARSSGLGTHSGRLDVGQHLLGLARPGDDRDHRRLGQQAPDGDPQEVGPLAPGVGGQALDDVEVGVGEELLARGRRRAGSPRAAVSPRR